jgi:hypothetical protein
LRFAWRTRAAACAALALTACGRGGGDKVEEITLRVPGWTLERAAMVGGEHATPDAALYDVISVEEDAAGNFYALNQGDKRILAFDSTGRFLRAIGRRGKGPGEMLAPLAIAPWGADGLFVLDPVNARLNRFRRSDGAFLGAAPAGGEGISLRRMRMTPDGRVFVEAHRPTVLTGARTSQPFVALMDTLTGNLTRVLELDPVSRLQVKQESGVRVMDRPFSPRPVWAVDSRGDVLFGTGSTFEVFRQAGGQRQVVVRGEGEAQPVTGFDRQAFLDRRRQQANAAGIDFPETKPFYNDLLTDTDDRVWVQTPRAEGSRAWEIFDRSGRKAGELLLPAKTYLRGISRGSLYVVQLDDNDVETLLRFRLRRS